MSAGFRVASVASWDEKEFSMQFDGWGFRMKSSAINCFEVIQVGRGGVMGSFAMVAEGLDVSGGVEVLSRC